MALDRRAFEQLQLNRTQQEAIDLANAAAAEYAVSLETLLPEGPDKTYCLRTLRTLAMWANQCILRHSDGRPRE